MIKATKAIETIYNGYLMRSRLEARWAMFFDALGIKWEYEVEGYVLSDGTWYLPDFFLPELKRWVEIKGQEPMEEEKTKMERLEEGTGYPSCIFHGLPGENDGTAYYTCAHENGAGKSISDSVRWKECPRCQKIDVSIRHYDGCTLYSEVDGIQLANTSCDCLLQGVEDSPRISIARITAKQARFEHKAGIRKRTKRS